MVSTAHNHHVRKLILRDKPLWCASIDRRTGYTLPHSFMQQLKCRAKIRFAIAQIRSYTKKYNHPILPYTILYYPTPSLWDSYKFIINLFAHRYQHIVWLFVLIFHRVHHNAGHSLHLGNLARMVMTRPYHFYAMLRKKI